VAIKVLDGTLRADDVVLVDNQRGIYSSRGDVVIHNSVIEGNTLAGITNATPTTGTPIDATENYWGDADGPTLPTMPFGTEGDSVTTDVLVAPFLTDVQE
jgi:adhesin HecA-like repeat protein